MKRIESVKNERVKAWKKLHSKKGRDQTGRFLIEGEHLIEEAWKSDWKVETVLTTADDENLFPGECIGVSEAVMKELSETKSPQGIVAVCQKKQWHTPEQLKGRFVLLDRVQDPGNVGTIIRTALAADAAGVVLGSGCADLFNAKVIRATQGALFHLPVYMGDLATWIKMLKESDIPVYGTSLHDATPYEQFQPQEQFALLLGNEGEGVQSHLLDAATENLFIRQNRKAESLNVSVAAGILLFALKS
ncbi:RNA methyltransferase [Shouchella clausii]